MTRGDTRLRILDATRGLVRRQGYAATGLKEIAASAEAPWSSLYHFFPGGKAQVIEEALRTAGAAYHPLIEAVFDASSDAPAGCRAWFELSARALERSDFADGCPVATAALEAASTSEQLRVAAWDVFASWIRTAARSFEADGWDPAAADRAARCSLGMLEGAILLSRTSRSTAPLLEAGEFAESSLRGMRP